MDELFQEAVRAIDSGDIKALRRCIEAHPEIVRDRLDDAGEWLRASIGAALDGYFARPYLLWFVAENPIRNERLPANIAEVAALIIDAAKRQNAETLQEQLDYAVRLVVTGRVARESGVQRELIDVLIDAGAVPGRGNGALGAGNLAAIEQFIERGVPVSLAARLCIDPDGAVLLAREAGIEERQTALVAAALNGKTKVIRTLLDLGVDVNAQSSSVHPHGTPLHHAVASGSFDAVTMLVEAGARLDIRDRIYDGTPLDWAEHLGQAEIASYLRAR